IDANGIITEKVIIIKLSIVDISLCYIIKKKIGYGKIKKEEKENKIIIEKKAGIEKIIKIINGKIRREKIIRKIERLVEKEKIEIKIRKEKEEKIKKTNWLAGYIDGKGKIEIKIISREERNEVRINFEIIIDEDIEEIKEL